MGAPVTVTITITPVTDAPIAQPDSYTVAEDGTLTVPAATGVLANDTDADGGSLSTVLASFPANGTLNLQTDGSFFYTPRADFSGTDSFTYRVSDGQGQSEATTVTITVVASNDVPVGSTDFLNGTEDTMLAIFTSTLVANDTDVDGDVLTVGEFVQPANGTLTRAASFSGSSFGRRFSDARGRRNEDFPEIDKHWLAVPDGAARCARADCTGGLHARRRRAALAASL